MHVVSQGGRASLNLETSRCFVSWLARRCGVKVSIFAIKPDFCSIRLVLMWVENYKALLIAGVCKLVKRTCRTCRECVSVHLRSWTQIIGGNPGCRQSKPGLKPEQRFYRKKGTAFTWYWTHIHGIWYRWWVTAKTKVGGGIYCSTFFWLLYYHEDNRKSMPMGSSHSPSSILFYISSFSL